MENLVDKTVLSTPKPCASSTIDRRKILKKIDKKYGFPPLDYITINEESQSDCSLGIISDIDQKDDLLIAKDSAENVSAVLQRQRQLAQSTLEKSKIGLPSRFLVASDTPCSTTTKGLYNDISTINESDLLKPRDHELRASVTSGSFIPGDVSTPRNSNIHTEEPTKKLSLILDEASKKVRNSDVNLTDLCAELSRVSMGQRSIQQGVSNIDSGMFVPAELMKEKLLQDELSWREKNDIPTRLKSISSMPSVSTYMDNCEAYSMGDYFRQKSEDVNMAFLKRSPTRSHPLPLIDLTNMTEVDESRDNTDKSSIMSASVIYKVLAEHGTQDAQQILNCLTNKKTKSKRRKPDESFTSERDVDEYILANKNRNKSTISPELRNFQSGQFNYNRKSDIPYVMTTSPTILQSDRLSGSKYDRFCQNLEIQSSSKISPGFVKNIEAEKSLLPPQTRTSKSPLCNGNTVKRTDSEHLNVNTEDYLTAPNSVISTITENKENISDGDRSLTSVRSGSSLDTLPEGKLPIKSNCLELIWGCLKPGRMGTQEFQIRNQLKQRIRMQASVTGSNFRIAKDSFEPEMLTTASFMMRPLETKSFSIMFCPTILGAASEKINFHPILGGEIQHTKRQVLTLFGYGGHVSCDLRNVLKDSSGKLWLSMGKIEYQSFVQQKFIIKNSGTLFAFACVDVVPKGLFTLSDLKVEPKEFSIKPQEEVLVTVRYCPSREDLKHLKKTDIVEVGFIKLITGADVTRGRLRRIYGKLKQQNTPVNPLIERLSNSFPGEKMPSDLKYLRESVSAARDLLMQLLFREITVTVEQDLEKTLVNPIIDLSETSMYHTLSQGDENTTEFGDTTTIRRDNPSLFAFEPNNVVLTLPIKREDTVLLYSKSPTELNFEIKTAPCHLFSVCPTHGVISPYEIVVLKIACRQRSPMEDGLGRILVYVENEVVEIIVKIVFIKSK